MSTSNDVDDDGTTADAGTPRRRRGHHRAVSRPAGPPAVAFTSEAAGTDQPSPDAPPAAAPAARPAASSALPLFQAAAAEPAAEAVATEAPAARTSRRRGSAPAADETGAVAAAAPAGSDRPDAAVGSPDGEPTAGRRPRRRRAASRPAGPPVEAPEPAAGTAPPEPAPAVAEPVAADELAAVEDVVEDDALDATALDGDAAEALDAAAAEQAEDREPAASTTDDAVDDSADEAGDSADEADDSADEADDSADEADDSADVDDDAEDGGSRPRRGRRRRGGRGRRRRTGEDSDETTSETVAQDAGEDAEAVSGDAAEASEASDETDDADAADESEDSDDTDDTDDGDAEGASSTSRRRRRRRRRGGGDDADEAGEPESGSTSSRSRSRSRRSRAESSDSGDVTAVKGSTRLEAKRQRRRDGRDGGRRPRVLSEAEFLARRESVERTMVVRTRGGRSQVAVLEDGVLVEHYSARKQQTSMIGNVHLGRVQNVLPSMEAAFVDIGRGRNAVLYAGEVDWEAAGLSGQAKKIESALKSGDPVLVQVTKDPIGHKGARLTSQVSLPGRYLVYVPGGTMTGISRKLPDTERSRLKSILKEVVPEDAGVIVRTAAEGASESELRRDVERLTAQWEEISARAKQVTPPTLLHGEPDLVIKVVRDVFNEDFAHLVVEGEEAWGSIKPYVDAVAPDLAERVTRWDTEGQGGSAFAHHRIDEQIAKALERKVWLPSGGSLVIDRTEAMTVVDVNTGRFTGSGGNLEETVTRNNLEAAEEIVRQLRLRDIGGIVVVDFIDMVLESNRDLVLRRLVECLGRDRSKHQVAEVTSLGLVQMTRKRVGQGLLETFSEPCEHCAGRGVVVQDDLSGHASHSGGGNGGGGNGGGGNGGHPPVPGPPRGRGEQRAGDRQDKGERQERGDRQSRAESRPEPRPESRPEPRVESRPEQDRGAERGARGARTDRAERGDRHESAAATDAADGGARGDGEARSREEAARDAVREAMNGIALATLRPGPSAPAPQGPSLEAAALLAALGGGQLSPEAPPADGAVESEDPLPAAELAVEREVVEVVDVVEVATVEVELPPPGDQQADQQADDAAGWVEEPGAEASAVVPEEDEEARG
ncbi:Rne/Rng family ribonuclease [Streptomyces sp. NP160]|uniref:Rne/Rng family ribonuclease n=1 Tax=Streptomyces sp. NP160 TaxID=2586637 RepID=UPI00214D12D4|nr:Rne/Rng family ribonuclease [Streptomyces sp. NP160]